MKVNALVIEPLKNVFFKDINLSKKNNHEIEIEWYISSVCNSERRRFNLTKSKDDKQPFIGGHEAIGFVSQETYPKKTYALLPHSNCLTRNDLDKCFSCENKTENLCEKMRHAGLDNNEPSGFSDKMYVSRSQLLDVSDIKFDRAPFLEPLSCVIRSWNLSDIKIKKVTKSFGIVGGGPIGCLHALYLNECNKQSQITIIESNDKRRKVLNQIFRTFSNIKISSNSTSEKFEVTVMACSTSSGFKECLRLLNKNGKLILFSGFNDTTFKNENYLPEIIHRYEFKHFVKNKMLIGSSGYTENDLMMSKKILQKFENVSKIITGKVYGLKSKKIHRFDGIIESYDEPVLIKDIKGELQSNHIKIQYFNKTDQ